MKTVKSYPNGVFCWVDLATTDTEAAKAFYASLFGWEHEDLPTDVGVPYTMFRIEGKNVAALSAMRPEIQAQGVPSYWSSYVKHDDVDAVAARITEAGGVVTSPPCDIMDSGRMLFAHDPTGAAFGVWQPAGHIGADLVNMPNTLVWNELQTRDSAAAKPFYSAVFDWTYGSAPGGYILCQTDGRTQAGIIQMDENWSKDVPNNWGVYFMVTDLAASVAKAAELGGSIMVPPTSAGEMGNFAVIQDPQGGVFTIMQFDGPVDPPPGA